MLGTFSLLPFHLIKSALQEGKLPIFQRQILAEQRSPKLYLVDQFKKHSPKHRQLAFIGLVVCTLFWNRGIFSCRFAYTQKVFAFAPVWLERGSFKVLDGIA